MTVTVDNIEFDDVHYDEDNDVLYLSVGAPQAAAWTDETLEGHAIRYGRHGGVIGLTIVGARWMVGRSGAVTITPPRKYLERSALEDVL